MQDTILSRALKAHREGKIDEAIELYSKIMNIGACDDVAAQNYGALLRSKGDIETAINIYEKGLRAHPKSVGMLNNYANCLRDKGLLEKSSLFLRKALSEDITYLDARLTLCVNLKELGMHNLAYITAKAGLKHCRNDRDTSRFVLILVDAIIAAFPEKEKILKDIEQYITKVEETETQNEYLVAKAMTMSQVWMLSGNTEKALKWYRYTIAAIDEQLDKSGGRLKKQFLKQWHTFGWNLSIFLIKKGIFGEGWKLYDHGLRVPAEGPQKWQRSLKKVFPADILELWKGQNVKNKNILLLGEQGIGDTMMFATLIPRLLAKGAKVAFFPGKRLEDIYMRSASHWKYSENMTVVAESQLKGLKSSGFDYQLPVGSLPMHLLEGIEDGPKAFKIIEADRDNTNNFRSRYRNKCGDKLIVGISWQGGGKKNRIRDKSIDLEDMLSIIKKPDVFIVSLQYGDDGPFIKRFNEKYGTNIHHDDEINPLKDMDSWLSQVNAVDIVVSIANTTIHGAGGLGKPTMCLLSNKCDWRWTDEDIYTGCYWYQSVETAYQSGNGDWTKAVKDASIWVSNYAQRFKNGQEKG